MDILSKIRVLYVEDDEMIREELSETIEFDVKELIVAENGEDGLEKFKKYNPDLVITDVKMPKMNGLQMSKEIKSISRNTPIIVTTAFSDSEYLMEAIKIGIDRYVTKPVDIDKLYDAMNELATILLYEKEKETQNKYLRYILDFNPSFILIASNKKIEYINKTFLKFLGFNSFEEFQEKVTESDNLVESVTDLDGNNYPVNNWMKQILNNPKTQHIIHFKHNSQKPFIVLQNSFKDLDKDILLFSDVTNLELNRLALNEEMEKLKEDDNQSKLAMLRMQAKQAVMGEMISAIAHQWKQPLNVLSMNIQLLLYEEEITESKVEDCVAEGMKQIEYMAKTIDDFRQFLAPDKEMEKFLVIHIINGVKELFETQLKVHNIKLIIDVDDNLEGFGYPNQVAQILMNLIKNSKDAFDNIKSEDKYIKITSKTEGNYSLIEIEDNAGGIPKEIKNKIFESYFTTKETGTGIGLYISKMLIEDMKGELLVESENNKTKFSIKFLRG